MTIGTSTASEAEYWFHRLFNRWRLHGEWFQVNRAQIDAAITLALAQFDGTLVELPQPKNGRFVDWLPAEREIAATAVARTANKRAGRSRGDGEGWSACINRLHTP